LVPIVFVLSAGMFVIVFVQVIFRYILNEPLPWSEELARYLMVWIASLGAVEAYGTGGHVGVNALVDNVPAVPRKLLRLLVHLVVAVLMVVILYQGFKLSAYLRDQVSPALEVPMTWPYLAIPAGATLLLLQALGLFFFELRIPPSRAPEVCGPRPTAGEG
jgi:TRAP-type C4-dicarboxylate transport system permease small subunit